MHITLSILLLFSLKFCFAAQEPSWHRMDTTILSKGDYKLGREEFLDKYSRDDSSRAFINFYFKKRSRWKQSLLVNAGLITLFSIAIYAALNSVETTATLGAAIGEVVIAVYLTLFVDVCSIIFIVDGILLLTHSRKKLLRILNAYNDGKPLPPNITRKRLFKKYLRLEHSHPPRN